MKFLRFKGGLTIKYVDLSIFTTQSVSFSLRATEAFFVWAKALELLEKLGGNYVNKYNSCIISNKYNSYRMTTQLRLIDPRKDMFEIPTNKTPREAHCRTPFLGCIVQHVSVSGSIADTHIHNKTYIKNILRKENRYLRQNF